MRISQVCLYRCPDASRVVESVGVDGETVSVTSVVKRVNAQNKILACQMLCVQTCCEEFKYPLRNVRNTFPRPN
jgi:hypothetical protein